MNKEKWLSRLPPDWRGAMEGIYEKGGISSLFSFLRDEGKEKKIWPKSEDLWDAFKCCPYKELKIVVIGESAYERVDGKGLAYADGKYLSCHKDTGELNCWYQQLEVQLYNGLKFDIGKDTILRYLGQEGILLLSMSPTVEEGKYGSHKEQWRPFMRALVENVLASHNNKILYLLIGEEAAALEKYILPFDTKIIKTESIREAARLMKVWNSNNFFMEADKWSEKHYGNKIAWVLPF